MFYTINQKSAENKSFDCVTYPCKKKRSTLANLCKVQAGYCEYTSMFVLVKWNVNAWDEYDLSYPYFPTIHFP